MNDNDVLLIVRRIEAKLDRLVRELSFMLIEDGDEPETDLDGNLAGGERDSKQEL